VHLGQDDLPLAVGRKLVGDKIIGISTHDLAQAIEAERNGADYIGFGPMFGTSTKETGYEARGLDRLREVHPRVKLPIVAIGGITENNVLQVWQAGASSAAIISDILRAEDIPAKVARILRQAPAHPQR
jgi:thiamine-phosphate pyrophosphorylase